MEGVIELFSHRDDRTSWIVSAFIVGDRNDNTETQGEKHLCPCMDAASGADVPEATALDCVVGSLNSSPAVVRLG